MTFKIPKIVKGYIIQPRSFDGSDASKMSPVTRELWFYLLRNVNHKDTLKYKRGQGFFSFGAIQEDLSWYVGYRKMKYSKPQLTKALRRLCEGNMTATAKATRGIIITVCNYSFYQDPQNYEGNDEGFAKELRRKSEGHTKNKNVKEWKNVNKKTKAKKDILKLYLKKQIKERKFSDVEGKIIEFYEYRMTMEKAKKYKTEKSINGLFRDLTGCRDKNMSVSDCLEEAMERNWLTPKPDYFNNKGFKNGKIKNYATQDTREPVIPERTPTW